MAEPTCVYQRDYHELTIALTSSIKSKYELSHIKSQWINSDGTVMTGVSMMSQISRHSTVISDLCPPTTPSSINDHSQHKTKISISHNSQLFHVRPSQPFHSAACNVVERAPAPHPSITAHYAPGYARRVPLPSAKRRRKKKKRKKKMFGLSCRSPRLLCALSFVSAAFRRAAVPRYAKKFARKPLQVTLTSVCAGECSFF